MARISTYNLDQGISSDDLLLGSSKEGTQNGQPIYATRNYRLSDLATFFQSYDADLNTSLSTLQSDVNTLTTSVNGLDSRITTLEGASGVDLTAFSVTTNPAGTASLSYDNLTGQFTYTPPDLSSFITSVAFSDLTSTPTTLAGYNIDDAFDGSYTSLTNVPTAFTPASHNHDDRYYTETEVDTLLNGYLTTSTNLSGLANVSSATPSTGQVLKWNGTAWAPGTDLQASGGTGISLTDLSVSVASAGTANLSYDNTSGTFTYTPPNVSSYISLTSISVGADASPSGNGGLAYNNTTGVFTYTPPDFSSGYLSTSGGTLTGNLILSSGANLTLQGGNVSVTGNVTSSGLISGANLVGNITGSIFSTRPGSVRVLQNGSGGTPNAYFIGDLTTNSDGTGLVFDTSEATFRTGVKIGTSSENLDLDLGATSQIVFARGTQQEKIIAASSTNNWDEAYNRWVRDIDFSEPTAGQIEITLTQGESETPGSPYTRALGAKILEGAGLTFSTSSGQLTMAVDSTEVLFINQLSNNVVTGISLDDGAGNVDTATSGEFTLIPGSGIGISRDGLNTNDITFVLDNSSLGFINQTDGDARYIRQTGTGFEPAQNGIMLKTGANTYGVTVNNSSQWDTAFGWGNHGTQGYLTSEVNDLTSSVTWANVPNANITQASVTQHQTALSITESQVSDLGNYVPLASGVTPTNGHVATYNNGELISSSITGILPSTTVFTSGSPNFNSNTITAGDFILSSDRELKENIIPLAEREIKVDFKEYNFKGSDRTRFGVIAQELEENHPEFVHTRESGDKSVSYIDLLVAKVHELENRIKELENGSRDR